MNLQISGAFKKPWYFSVIYCKKHCGNIGLKVGVTDTSWLVVLEQTCCLSRSSKSNIADTAVKVIHLCASSYQTLLQPCTNYYRYIRQLMLCPSPVQRVELPSRFSSLQMNFRSNFTVLMRRENRGLDLHLCEPQSALLQVRDAGRRLFYQSLRDM